MTAFDPAHTTEPGAGVVGYAYPWDVLGDPGFLDRVRELGIGKVALAAAYHTTRAATPLHPHSRLVTARSAALYRPVRQEAWEGRRLVPATASWVDSADSEDSFGEAARVLADAGIEVAAWIVLTHSSRLGEANPDLAVVNCFGETYEYALCPQSAEVREYATTLAAEAIRKTPCSAAVLEACGQLGLQHGGHHEKTDGAYDATTHRLLSICCCQACRAGWRAEGLDPDTVVATLRTAVEAAAGPGATNSPAAPDPATLEQILDTVLRVRQRGTDTLRRGVIDAVREVAGQVEIILHSNPDPWATGALPGLTPTAPDDVDTVVAQCWATGEAAVVSMTELATAVAGRATPGAYVTVLPPTTGADFGPHLSALTAAGMEQIHLYHLGLAGPDRQPMLAQATTGGTDR